MSEKKPVKSGDLNLQVVSGDDIVNNNPERVDIRFDKPLTEVLRAEDVDSYEIKKWPMMDDQDLSPTNAIGYPMGAWFSRKKEELKRQKEEAERAAREAALAAAAQAEEERKKQEEQLTVETLEKIQHEAYEEGYQKGLEQGSAEGFAQGLEKGHQEGLEKGLNEGLEKGYDDGFVKGREEGFKKGHEDGLQGGESIVLEQVERFRHLADQLANPLREVDRDVTDEIVYLVSRLAKVVIGHEVKGDLGYLKNSLEKAVAVLPNADKGAKIYLNPDDKVLIETSLGKEYLAEQKWDLNEDPDLAIGDVRVINEASTVNWRLNDRIDSLLEDFLGNASVAVDKALREEIEGAPAYDEIPQKPLAPPPDLRTVVKKHLEQQEVAAEEPQEQETVSEEVTAQENDEALEEAERMLQEASVQNTFSEEEVK